MRPLLRSSGPRPHGGSMRPSLRPTGHRPHGPSMNPRRPTMNDARPYKSYFIQAPSYEIRPFLKSSVVKTPYRAPWVPTVNRYDPPVNRKFSTGRRNFPTANRKFPTVSRKFTTDSTRNHTADMGKKGKAVLMVDSITYGQEMVNILVLEEEYDKVFNHLDMLHTPFKFAAYQYFVIFDPRIKRSLHYYCWSSWKRLSVEVSTADASYDCLKS
nr:hypothetical protein [Tanacetum cinerariifolium]